MLTVIKGITKASEEGMKQILENGGEILFIDGKASLEPNDTIYQYTFTADLEVEESEIQTLSFNVSLKELEEDYNIIDILTLKLESYIQEKYCSCSFNETQNHCDCELGDYHIIDILDRKLLTAVLEDKNPLVSSEDFNNHTFSLGTSRTGRLPYAYLFGETPRFPITHMSMSEDKKNNFVPISIWDYNIGNFHYIFEVTHDAGDTKDSAIEIANHELIDFGIFIDADLPLNKKLIYGSKTKNGMFMHIPQNNVKVKILKPKTQERLAPPIPMDSEENKKKAIDALMNMNEFYMVIDDDYVDVSDSIEDIVKNMDVNVTKDTPLLFDSIAYRVEEK